MNSISFLWRAGLLSDVLVDGAGAAVGLALFILVPLCARRIMQSGRRICRTR